MWKPFWAAQQRFFKLLCVSMKVGQVVKEAQAALQAGYAGEWVCGRVGCEMECVCVFKGEGEGEGALWLRLQQQGCD